MCEVAILRTSQEGTSHQRHSLSMASAVAATPSSVVTVGGAGLVSGTGSLVEVVRTGFEIFDAFLIFFSFSLAACVLRAFIKPSLSTNTFPGFPSADLPSVCVDVHAHVSDVSCTHM